jgi:acyl dehydratase
LKYFEDFRVGEKMIATADYAVTQAEIIEFGTRFDPQPFHTDPEAAKESIFGDLVASSTHLFCIAVWFSNHLGRKVAAVSSLGFDELRTLSPARPGDRLSLRCETTLARVSKSRPDCGIIGGYSEVYNQRDEIVLSYKNAFLVSLRTPPSP